MLRLPLARLMPKPAKIHERWVSELQSFSPRGCVLKSAPRLAILQGPSQTAGGQGAPMGGPDSRTAALQCPHLRYLPTAAAAWWPALGGFVLSMWDLCIILLRCPGVLLSLGVRSSIYFFWQRNRLARVLLSPTFYFRPPSCGVPPPQLCRHNCLRSHPARPGC